MGTLRLQQRLAAGTMCGGSREEPVAYAIRSITMVLCVWHIRMICGIYYVSYVVWVMILSYTDVRATCLS